MILSVGDVYADPVWLWADDVIANQVATWSGDTVDTSGAGTFSRTSSATNIIDTTQLNLTIMVLAANAVTPVTGGNKKDIVYRPDGSKWVAVSS